MTALKLYEAIKDHDDRRRVREAALRAAHPTHKRLPRWNDSDVATQDNHPALVDALRAHWWIGVREHEIMEMLDAESRAREFSRVFVALAHTGAYSPFVDASGRAPSTAAIPALILCIDAYATRVDLAPEELEARDALHAMAAGEIPFEQMCARLHVTRERRGADGIAWRTFVRDAFDDLVRSLMIPSKGPGDKSTVWMFIGPSFGDALRTLYPDPCAIDGRDAVRRVPAALEVLLRSIVFRSRPRSA